MPLVAPLVPGLSALVVAEVGVAGVASRRLVGVNTPAWVAVRTQVVSRAARSQAAAVRG